VSKPHLADAPLAIKTTPVTYEDAVAVIVSARMRRAAISERVTRYCDDGTPEGAARAAAFRVGTAAFAAAFENAATRRTGL
jgi:hypothetical protein